MCFPGLFGGAKGGDGGARAAEEQRQARIRAGMEGIDQNFAKFDDTYYDGLKTKYTDYYTPQLTDQYQKARQNLILELTRTGGINSSAGAQKLADLDLENQRQSQSMTDSALQFATQGRQDVERNRSEVVNQLNASADPAAAAAAATQRSQILQAAPAFSPIGELFTRFLQQGGNAAMAESKGYPGWKTGLFNTRSSAKVVN
jgi:hypothetical protein